MRVCNMFSLQTAGVVGPLCTSLWAPQQFFFNTFLHLGFDYGMYPPTLTLTLIESSVAAQTALQPESLERVRYSRALAMASLSLKPRCSARVHLQVRV